MTIKNCFTVERGRVTVGIKAVVDIVGVLVGLGETGRGRQFTVVRATEPTIENKTIVSASFRHNRLVPREEHDAAFIVRVSSDGAYTRGRAGRVMTWLGTPTRVAEGRGADGDAGRIGSWEDTLYTMLPGDSVVVLPTNGGKTESFVVARRGDELLALTWEQARALVGQDLQKGLLAREQVEQLARHAQTQGWKLAYEAAVAALEEVK